MAARDIIVIGASAGGLQAAVELLTPLAIEVPAAIFITVHTAPEGVGMFAEILERATAFTSCYAKDGMAIRHGHVYIAPPDQHLLVKRGRVRVTNGPRENRFRPAVDPLFRTAARAYGARVIGIVLSGGLDDGTHGLELIKRHGGVAIAQDPHSAVMPSMPLSAIQNVDVDHILSPSAIAAKLPYLVSQDVEDSWNPELEEPDVAEGIPDNLQTGHIPGPPSPFTCPECGGALWELDDGKLVRFRCHVGHGYTADSLAADQDETLEYALWSGLRALEEAAALRRRMAQHAHHVGRHPTAREYEDQAKEAERRASVMRKFLMRPETDGASPAGTGVADNGHRRPRKKATSRRK